MVRVIANSTGFNQIEGMVRVVVVEVKPCPQRQQGEGQGALVGMYEGSRRFRKDRPHGDCLHLAPPAVAVAVPSVPRVVMVVVVVVVGGPTQSTHHLTGLAHGSQVTHTYG